MSCYESMNVPFEMYVGGHFEKLKFVSLMHLSMLSVKPAGWRGVRGGGGAWHKAGI